MSPQNINNLFLQTGYIAVLGVGMTLVIIIRHIDLSVGYGSGFLGAVTAILLVHLGLPIYLVIPIVLLVGLLVGFWNGFFVAVVGIPSFVTTLAGMLIFHGALLKVTNSSTILTNNNTLKAIGSGYLPSWGMVHFGSYGLHLLTLILGIVAVLAFILNELRTRKIKKQYQFEVPNRLTFMVKIAIIGIVAMAITWLQASYKGLSWTVLIVIIVVFIYQFVSNHTVIGRHIYAIGGNPEAAKLSGISVEKITFLVFGSMGMLSALSGILYTARLNSATPSAGTAFELDAIAAAFIGGVRNSYKKYT